MSPSSKPKKQKMKNNEYVVPKNKKQLIQYINEAGVKDIICMSSIDEGFISVGFEIITKDNKSFYIGQDVVLNPTLSHVEVLDTSTGDCYPIEVNMGKEFNSKEYKYKIPAAWSLKID